MKRFRLTQKFDAPSEVVLAAYRDQTTWEQFAELPFLGDPIVDSFSPGEPTMIAVKYRVSVELPAAAAPFIDARKMTFVELTTLHADGTGTFDIQPDHYSDLFESSGRIELVPFDGGRCERVLAGHVHVSLGWSGKLWEPRVEDIIVNGLKKSLASQARQVPLG